MAKNNIIRCYVIGIVTFNILAGILTIGASPPKFSTNGLNNDARTTSMSKYWDANRFKVHNNTCMTEGCFGASLEILKNIDKRADPCDDFYQFACGTFLERTHIPDDKVSVTQFTILDDILTDQVKELFEQPVTADDLRPFVQAKSAFNCCMNEEKIEKLGVKPSKDLAKRLGGWPVIEKDWNEESFSWEETAYKLRKEGNNFELLLELSVVTDMKNSTARLLEIDEPNFGLEREYLIEGFGSKIIDGYYKYMVDIAVIFEADRNRATEELKQSLQFEIDLANVTLPRELKRDANKLYNPMKISELQANFPIVPWLKFINTLLAIPEKITENETIVVTSPKYLIGLQALLEVTPKRVIANYLLWRTVASSIFFLNKEVRDRQLQFSSIVSGLKAREPRWKECISLVSGTYVIAASSMYVRRYFKQDSRRTALLMVEEIREQMYKTLNNVDWMDERTKKIALDKARAIVNHIGYPGELFEDDKILKFYEKLTVDPNEYLDSLRNVSRFWTDYIYTKLREPVNKTDWTTHCEPAVVNAFYDPMENSIQFPAGILQHIFFSHDRPQYLNFGGIGFIVSHEITHGFDDEGKQFDKNGNLLEWWSADTKKRFTEKAQCFINQSNHFSPKGFDLKLKGVNVQGEAIADNGGIRNAYYAYLEYLRKHGDEPKLPSLQEYTSQQMFWLGAANIWCAKYRPETMKVNIQTGYHPPCEFRVDSTFANQPEFARDFNCPLGSKMNPPAKCKIW